MIRDCVRNGIGSQGHPTHEFGLPAGLHQCIPANLADENLAFAAHRRKASIDVVT